MTPEEICRAHWFEPSQCRPFGDGHINDSFLVSNDGNEYVLQRVNRFVFHRAGEVMDNITRVSRFVASSSLVQLASLVPVKSGADYAWVNDDVWRLWRRLPGRTLQRLETRRQAQSVASAYGRFQVALAGLPGEPWADPIEGFFRLPYYVGQYESVRQKKNEWDAEIDSLLPLVERFSKRDCYIHGDCKVNNVLLDTDDEVTAVLDLDTVMYGHWAWDFGDLARSACSRGGEFDLDLFAGVLDGFAPSFAMRGAEPDVDDLFQAPCYVAGILALRFLTDHLQGDLYFKVLRRGDNLLRAQEQFKLLDSMRRNNHEMKRLAMLAIEE